MKKIIIFSVLAMSSQLSFAFEKYAYDCICSSPKKNCDALENMNVLVESESQLQANIGDSEWEFNESLTAKLSHKKLPVGFNEGYLRFDVMKTEYLPDMYQKGAIIIPKFSRKRKEHAALLDKKTGKIVLNFNCQASNPDHF